MSVEALCVKRRGTALQPGEFVVDVRLPALSGPSGGAYVHSPPDPTAGDPVAAGAFLVMQDDLETCCGARLTVWAAGQPLRALDAERFLQGRRLDQAAVSTAGDLTAQVGRLPTLPRSANERGGALNEVACQAILRALERARPHHASDSGAGVLRPNTPA
jgi:CO/xanthine dehydrogenase FAD-binding subunit